MKTCFSYFPSKNFPLKIIAKAFILKDFIILSESTIFFASSRLEMKLLDHRKCPEFRKTLFQLNCAESDKVLKEKGRQLFRFRIGSNRLRIEFCICW